MVVTLYFLMWEPANVDGMAYPDLHRVMESSNILRLGPESAQDRELVQKYTAPSKAITEIVLQRLSELRATYKQLGPALEVVPTDSDEHQRVADSITNLLGTYNLSSSVKPKAHEIPPAELPLILYCSTKDMDLAYKFLSAIAPYIHGAAVIMTDPEYSPGRMRLFIQGTVYFSDNGVAVFE
ncbi:hypothetical protein QP938_06590 [Porticoccaceae bacterium LTM1]|nr:hypothetical protein QP938_06590 [Porticoccaceae bacterium LTM1]